LSFCAFSAREVHKHHNKIYDQAHDGHKCFRKQMGGKKLGSCRLFSLSRFILSRFWPFLCMGEKRSTTPTFSKRKLKAVMAGDPKDLKEMPR
jgi:hypothetical protein